MVKVRCVYECGHLRLLMFEKGLALAKLTQDGNSIEIESCLMIKKNVRDAQQQISDLTDCLEEIQCFIGNDEKHWARRLEAKK
jgi:hypothetical protein